MVCAQANVRVSASIDLKTLITTVMRAQVTERTNERCVQSATRQEAQGVKTTTPQLRSAASASAAFWSSTLRTPVRFGVESPSGQLYPMQRINERKTRQN